MGHRPVDDEDRNQIVRLHAQGLSRNAIARAIGRSGRTVSRIAAELDPPLTFERGEQVQAATQAKVIDAKARRAQLALDLLDDAERLRLQLFAPTKAFNFGGKDNSYNETLLEEPTFTDKLKIVQAAATAIGKAIDIDKYDAGTGLDGVVSLLDRVAAGLAAKYGDGNDEHPSDDSSPDG